MSSYKVLNMFSAGRILIPVMIGLSVSSYFLFRDFDTQAFSEISWGIWTFVFLALAFVMTGLRDLAYMYRVRLITGHQLSWKKSFHVIFLWEFASCLTPSVVGGSAVAMFILNKEGITLGKSTALVMITALFDELFYITIVPFIVFMIGADRLFVNANFAVFGLFEWPTQWVFLVGYLFILMLTTILTIGIFIFPRVIQQILSSFFSLPFLSRWRSGAVKVGEEIVQTSVEMKGKSALFWIKLYSATFISWTARFAVVNCLILSIGIHADQLLVFGKQLVMWVILLISPTPGGSGVAEIIFPVFFSDIIAGHEHTIALSWRMISFYLYLIIGSIILPVWLRRVSRTKSS